jgi:hemerythrin
MVMLGAVGGGDRLSGTVVSDAVNLAARLEEATRTYGTAMLVSESTLYGLQGAAARQVRFVDRIRVKGKRQPQSIYEIFDADPAPLRAAKAARRAEFEQAVAAYHLRAPDQALPLLERCVAEAPDDGPARLYLDRCREYLASGKYEGTGELDTFLAWRDEFTLGVATIDDQHRELLDAMNRLVPHLQAGEAAGGAEVFAFLERYAVEHFGTEEELMRARGYPFLAEHLVEHANFVDFFARLRRDVQAGRGGRLAHVFQAQVFLLDWFANHSTSTDRHLTRWLRERGVA